jgi:formylglycine-generating enzyme required for sulfatase activity
VLEDIMARIFVSYSRKNKDFCKRLTDELQKRDLDFWVDWEGIPPTVDWMNEIEKGIEEADAFLAIVSPDWISSKICLDELNMAVKNGKRLIPVVPVDIVWNEVPSTLAHLNFIFFTETVDFDQQLEKLLAALDTDYDWLKTQRRLQVKALDWERANKDNGFLLRGKDLDEAEEQISINATKDPNPTDLQREYVLKSRQAADRQKRITTGVLVFIILMLVGISAYLITPYIQEAVAKNQARGELVSISAGTFHFGTNNELALASGAIPARDIPLPAFQIGKYEVTNKQYKLCVTYGNCTVPLEQTDYQNDKKENLPVVYVTLFQANNYCHWVGQRLLTEVEWERAARGPEGKNPWPWGTKDPTPEFVNMPALDTGLPTPGLKEANSNADAASVPPESVYNLVGNVWEWTSSYFYLGGEYDMSHWDGSSETFKGTAYYATRGGGWANKIDYISQSNPNTGTDVREDLGVRCGADTQ